jgi:signal transduction histidine kinase
MFDDSASPSTLSPNELEAVYAISNAVASVTSIDDALDEIIHLTRPVLIFDNIVVYIPNTDGQLEPAYARIIGRGRSAQGDLDWGGMIATEVFHSEATTSRVEKLSDWQSNRLSLRLLLGLPLRSRQQTVGVLVFGRFGGPPYVPEQIHLAEFVAIHIAQLLVRQQLVAQVANLQAERRLRELQDNFIATISHELCSPLGFIKGYATTLLRDDISWDDSTRREFLQIIDEETDRLRELIDNLLDSSRLQAGTLRMQIQHLRLDMLLHELVLRARHRFQDLSIELNPIEFQVQADPVRLTQVFDNLIGNAVKYAPGSPVMVDMKIISDNAHRSCQIAIRDQGRGIAPEHIERLFERFYRVPEDSEKVHGTGLGLYICREIIRVHDGSISVESTVGQGTTFLISLPECQRNPGE